MPAHMKAHHTKTHVKVVIVRPNSKKVSYINVANIGKLEAFLDRYSEVDDEAVAWEVLAKERIEKYKKAGLVLRGMRYRENMTQQELAKI